MKIAVGMSGGVDSSVVAKMLVDEGHEVVGLFLKLWNDPSAPLGVTKKGCNKDNRCCDYEALEDARKVANQLGIPFYVINATEAFKKAVVDNFLTEYKSLRTPNPCIVCNDKIKFDLLLRKSFDIGCEKLATGHYARIQFCHSDRVIKWRNPSIISKEIATPSMDSTGSPQAPRMAHNDIEINYETIQQCNNEFRLLAGLDESKDQSYMLYRLNQNQLAKILFPLGEMTKKEVRALASKWDLPVKEKPESQEICFVNDDYRSFLRRYLPETFNRGDIVTKNGEVIGKHEGLTNYTIGQRKGINQVESQKAKAKSNNLEDSLPLYVIGFDKGKNQLIVGEDQATYKTEMMVTDLSWIDPVCHREERINPVKTGDFSPTRNDIVFCHPELVSGSIKVKIRYRHPAVGCQIEKKTNCVIPTSVEGSLYNNKILNPAQDDTLKVLFKTPQRAISPGQSAVFYLGDQVLGGGLILE